jgi:hypothetical protein
MVWDAGTARRNYRALVVDFVGYAIAIGFLDPVAVVPLMLRRLGAGAMIVGGYAAITLLAFTLPQVFVAHGMHGRQRIKPILAIANSVTRVPMLLLPAWLWIGAASPGMRSLTLVAVVATLVFWALGDGAGYVPWLEIMARSFDERVRGRMLAATSLVSGVGGLGIAVLVERILASPRLPFPHNFAVLAIISVVGVQLSLAGVLALKEPRPACEPSARSSFGDYLAGLPRLMRSNPTFVRLAAIQLLVGFGGAPARFYVLFAADRFRLPDAWGGTYQVLQAAGLVAMMPLLARINERRHPGAGVRFVAFVCMITPIIALTAGQRSPWLFGIVFLLLGGSLNWGMWIAVNHYLLSHVSERERPTFIGLLNLLLLPAAVFPILGGLLYGQSPSAQPGRAPALFLLTAVVVGAGFLLTLRLPSPKEPAG